MCDGNLGLTEKGGSLGLLLNGILITRVCGISFLLFILKKSEKGKIEMVVSYFEKFIWFEIYNMNYKFRHGNFTILLKREKREDEKKLEPNA